MSDSIAVLTNTTPSCHPLERIEVRVFRIQTGDNGIFGPGYKAYFRKEKEFYCRQCGQVYKPTESNKLGEFNTSHLYSLLFKTTSLSLNEKKEGFPRFSKVSDTEYEEYFGVWGSDILMSLRLVPKEDRIGGIPNMREEPYWDNDNQKLVFFVETTMVPMTSEDIVSTPRLTRGDQFRNEGIRKGTAQKSKFHQVPIHYSPLREVYGRWDGYHTPLYIPECFIA